MTDITSYIGTYCVTKKTWKKRFAGIANEALTVYKIDGSDDVEDIHIHMNHVETFETVQGSTDTALPSSIADRPFAFCLRMKNKKAFFFDCRTEELLKDWLDCIQRYVKPLDLSPEVTSPLSASSRGSAMRQSIIMEGMKLWKDTTVYDDLIDGLASIAHPLRTVDDINAPELLNNFYIASFLKSRRENIQRILKEKRDDAKLGYILLDFIQYLPATHFVNAPQATSKKAPPPLLPKKNSFTASKPPPPAPPGSAPAAAQESVATPDEEKKKPRRLRPKKNMKKIFNKLAKTASGRNVFDLETGRTASSSSLLSTESSEYHDAELEEEGEQEPEEEVIDTTQEEVEEPAPVRIDFFAMEKRRGAVLSNPKVKRLPPVPPPKVKKPLPAGDSQAPEEESSDPQENVTEQEEGEAQQEQQLDESQPTEESAEIIAPEDDTITLDSPAKRKTRRKKRTAPSRPAAEAVALLNKVDNERETLTNIESIKEDANVERETPALPKKVPLGVPMMGFALPQGDLRSVLKKANNAPPFAKSPKESEKTTEAPQFDFRSVLKSRQSPASPANASKSEGPQPAAPKVETKASTEKSLPPKVEISQEAQEEIAEVTMEVPLESVKVTPLKDAEPEEQSEEKAVTPEPKPADTPKGEQTDSSSTEVATEKSPKRLVNQVPIFPVSQEGEPVDFRAVLKKTKPAALGEKESDTGSKSTEAPQFDFRSVLKKTNSTYSPKQAEPTQQSPKEQFDFRSVLRKTRAPVTEEKKEVETGPKQIDFRSVLKKTRKNDEEQS